MAYIDYYKTLGIDKNADDKAIKAAYRKLARKLHPDLNPNDPAASKKFQELNEANEVLSDPAKRKKYDQYGENWQHADQYDQAKRQQQAYGNPAGGYGGYQSGYENFGGDADFSDFFNSMFGGAANGGGGRRGATYRGQDFNAEFQLNLRDILETHKRTLTVNGKQIRLTIPAGVENGQTIKIAGHGGPGRNNGPAGDLFLKFVINNDPDFKRNGKDLYRTIKVDLYTAVLGGEITADTLTGKVKLKLKPETQQATKVKLKGKGMPVYKREGEFGDLYLTYDIELPTNLTDEQRELFEQLAKTIKKD